MANYIPLNARFIMTQSEYDKGYHDGYMACKRQGVSGFLDERREERAANKAVIKAEREMKYPAEFWKYIVICGSIGIAFLAYVYYNALIH